MNNRQAAQNKKFVGISINSGRVHGTVCLYSGERQRSVSKFSLANAEKASEELERYDEILVQCSHELNRIASQVATSIGKAEAEIFLTQKHIMNDPKIVSAIRSAVEKDRRNLEWAISEVFRGYEEKFAGLDNAYLRERAGDIMEVRRRLLGRLNDQRSGFVCHGQKTCSRGKDRIIVAEDLTAEMIVNMDVDRVLGFVTEHGGITSHAAIIARSLGIPAVSGIQGIMEYTKCGDEILIDGDRGVIILNPDEKTLEAHIAVERVDSEEVCLLGSPPGMSVLANASSVEDVQQAARVRSDGVGLFRTEILFIKTGRLISEEEQFVYYLKAAQTMGDKTVTFRLLDIGGDKQLPFLKLKQEENPFLGWRGSRFLLGNPEILNPQLRALGRVSLHKKIRIMFPMVVDVGQQVELLSAAKEVLANTDSMPENIQFGAMFEIPSAFFQAREIFKLIDFGSVGSNDLIQYLFAIDRGNELVSHDYDPDHPVLWNLLETFASTAAEMNKDVSICGELAGREGMPTRLVGAGLKTLSVAPRLVPRVRNELARSFGEPVKK
ncbi:MAG: phosphoenolpyruvate--protein phosphotransferase [Chitinispirillaceae bacterium]